MWKFNFPRHTIIPVRKSLRYFEYCLIRQHKHRVNVPDLPKVNSRKVYDEVSIRRYISFNK